MSLVRTLAGARWFRAAMLAAVVVSILNTAAKPATAGAVGGERAGSSVLAAYSSHSYHIMFRAGELASVAIVGDGSSDLDLFVYDENGNLVASDTGGSDTALAQWRPRWTGYFTIRVVNRGALSNLYGIGTN